MRRAVTRGAVAVGVAALLVGTGTTTATALDDVSTRTLRRAVTVHGIVEHERQFQRIADDNGGNRAAGTPGYDASVEYVAETLRESGYAVTLQSFELPFYRETGAATLAQVTPAASTYATSTFTYSGSGDVTGTVVPVDLADARADDARTTSSGCQPADFPTAPAQPAIALLQRGGCDFGVKADNAQAAGYDAAIIFDEGQQARTESRQARAEGQVGRSEVVTGSVGRPSTLPVVGASSADGSALAAAAAAGTTTVRVSTSTDSRVATTQNVIADSPPGETGQTVVVGAHLDSVDEGPGINDNGSGSATILEIAQEMAELEFPDGHQRQVRFAFWGAEELGLLGSRHYVENLTEGELDAIDANLNFDMVGSPNYVRFVYDGDGSNGGPVGPPGSGELESVFTDHLASRGLAHEPTEFNGRSDYGPFIAAGIPAGGLFSGAEGIKTAAQAAEYGGTAGEAYDSCYHQACDDLGNLNSRALSELGDAAADAVLTLTLSRAGLVADGSRRARQQVAPATAPEEQSAIR